MTSYPVSAAAARRRAVRVAVRLGIVMLASGAQTREVETTLRAVKLWDCPVLRPW